MLGIVDNKFVIGRDQFCPISAEIHYFRVPKKYWSICFERIKKAGFRIISSFVPWNLHEEKPGEFDFQGFDNQYKDLIVFLELAREFGFKIILRPGPWIKAEWPGGGLPKYIFNDESIIARNASGGLLSARNTGGVPPSYQPTYLHPKYLSHVRRYVGGLVEAIQNYIFPKGPVFLIQLDNEMDFGGNDKIFDADYNSYIVTDLYPAFLESKYGDVKNLPPCYGRVRTFVAVTPPTELVLKKPEHLIIYFNWLEFKGQMLLDYLTTLRERWESLGVGCMFSVALPQSCLRIPVPWEKVRGDRTILGTSIDTLDDLAFGGAGRKLRLVKNLMGYSWSSQLALGEPQNSEVAPRATDYRRQRFLIISSMAAGLKGFNFYMFVGRSHWAGSPLSQDGTVNQNYEDIRKLNLAYEIVDLSSTRSRAQLAIGLYRPYDMYDQITSGGELSYVNDLVNQTFSHLGEDFSGLSHDYEVIDLESTGAFMSGEEVGPADGGVKMLFVPVAEYMADDVQKRLINLVEKGLTVVFIGLVPRYNLLFRPSRVLARGLGIQTRASYGPAQITADEHTFKSLAYGYIQNKSSAKVEAKADARVYGACRKLGKGKFYFFTYDLSTRGEPGKLSYLKSLAAQEDIRTPVVSSDPDVEAVIHTNEQGAVLYLLNTDTTRTGVKKVVVAIDLTEVGMRQAKAVLHNIFDPEAKIKTTSQELKEGLIFEMGQFDARIYFIPKKQ